MRDRDRSYLATRKKLLRLHVLQVPKGLNRQGIIITARRYKCLRLHFTAYSKLLLKAAALRSEALSKMRWKQNKKEASRELSGQRFPPTAKSETQLVGKVKAVWHSPSTGFLLCQYPQHRYQERYDQSATIHELNNPFVYNSGVSRGL
jgi:hypothetical protein